MARELTLAKRIAAGASIWALSAAGLMLTTTPAAGAEQNVIAESGDGYYLALGDSLAQGYARPTYDKLKETFPNLGYVRLACGGENSTGFTTAGKSSAWLGWKMARDAPLTPIGTSTPP